VITYPILAYLAVLWWLRREPVVHALAVNWAANQAAVMMNSGFGNLPVFVLVDFLTGIWLALNVRTKTARHAATFFLPMIALNAAAYAAGNIPEWHHSVLFGLAWLQLLWVVIGVKGNGMVETMADSGRRLRNSISLAFAFFRGAK